MRNHKGFSFSIKTVMLIVTGVIAGLTVMAFLNDGTAILGEFSNTTLPEGGIFGRT